MEWQCLKPQWAFSFLYRDVQFMSVLLSEKKTINPENWKYFYNKIYPCWNWTNTVKEQLWELRAGAHFRPQASETSRSVSMHIISEHFKRLMVNLIKFIENHDQAVIFDGLIKHSNTYIRKWILFKLRYNNIIFTNNQKTDTLNWIVSKTNLILKIPNYSHDQNKNSQWHKYSIQKILCQSSSDGQNVGFRKTVNNMCSILHLC